MTEAINDRTNSLKLAIYTKNTQAIAEFQDLRTNSSQYNPT